MRRFVRRAIPDHIKLFFVPGAQLYESSAIGGTLNVFVSIEPFNDDGSSGVHVSASLTRDTAHQTPPSDDDMRAIAAEFMVGRDYEEQSIKGSLVRHLWEKQRKDGEL